MLKELVELGAPPKALRRIEGQIQRIYLQGPKDFTMVVKDFDFEESPLEEFAKRLLAEP